jgi:fibronectin type 3 domain-containing protein
MMTLSYTFYFIPETASAQIESGDIRYVAGDEGVYIFHTTQIPPGEGFNLYKQRQGEDQFVKLNEEPIQGVIYPENLPAELGELYPMIAGAMSAETVEEVFFGLRSGSVTGRIYTFSYPEVASALGRLYIDRTTAVGETVSYRIEFVDDLGMPTGDSLEETLTIDEITAPEPSNISLSNEGFGMQIEWFYPPMQNQDDKIIRFEILEADPGSDEFVQVNENIILRDNAREEYVYYFNAIQLNLEKDYIIAPVNIANERSSLSERVTYFIQDNVAPSVVENVNAEWIGDCIELTWAVSPETDMEGYRVYRSENLANGTQIYSETLINPLEPYFLDSDVIEGRQYFYQITAVDNSGNESAKSASAMRSIGDTTPPGAPTGLTAEFQDSSIVQVSWDGSGMPDDFRRYILLRRKLDSNNESTFEQLGGDDYQMTRYIDQGISNLGFEEGVFYEYGVLAADSSRNFSDTTRITIQIPNVSPPEAPALVVAENQDGIRLNVNWLQSTSGDVVSYNLVRQLLNSEQESISETSAGTRFYRDEDISSGNVYRYGVSAVDSSGNESMYAYSEYIQARSYDPPRQVRNVRVRQSESGPELFWEPVPSDQLAGYKVYRSTSSTGIYESLNENPVTETVYLLPDNRNNVWYRVRAVDRSGNESRPSEPVRFGR